MTSKTDHLVRFTSTVGNLSEGIIYVLMGAFAFMAGLTSSDEKGSSGVLMFIVEQPFGKVLLSVLILGLICVIVWRMSQAFLNSEDKEWPMRLAYLVIGLTFCGITVLAIQALFGNAESDNSNAESWSSWILSFPLGQ